MTGILYEEGSQKCRQKSYAIITTSPSLAQKAYNMNEVNQTADAAAEPKQATNISASEFVNMRIGQINSQVEEQDNQTAVEETEEEVVQEEEETPEVSAEDVTEVDETEEEEPQEEETESEEDVLSKIELDDMSDEELRELSDKLGSRAVARFGELTAKRKAAEAEIERLKAEMSSKLEPKVKESENPYRNINSIEELQNQQEEVERVIEWAEDLIFNSDGYSADDPITEVEGKELTKADVRKHLLSARKAEKKFIPAQMKTIQRRQGAAKLKESLEDQAKEELSWLQDDNEVNQKYQEMLKDPRLSNLEGMDPEVSAQLPYLLAHAANSMYGKRTLIEPEKKAAVKASRLKPPSGTPGAARSDKKVSSALKNLQAASNRFKESGNKNDFIKMRTLQFSQ